jgi:hypothetical protein
MRTAPGRPSGESRDAAETIAVLARCVADVLVCCKTFAEGGTDVPPAVIRQVIAGSLAADPPAAARQAVGEAFGEDAAAGQRERLRPKSREEQP